MSIPEKTPRSGTAEAGGLLGAIMRFLTASLGAFLLLASAHARQDAAKVSDKALKQALKDKKPSSVETAARELLLSVLLFPSLVPLWIGAVKLTHALWNEGTMDPVRDWLKVMAVMDVLGLALAAWLYEAVQEAGE